MKHTGPGLRWLINMAWRDSRRNRSRLLLFITSVILGIGSLVAVFALRENLQKNVDAQAAMLLGADLRISSNKPATDSLFQLLRDYETESAEEWSFASMIYFPASGGSRLIQVRALQGAFPFYGELETIPVEAGRNFQNGRKALIEKNLLLQYDASVGDSVQIGDLMFEIAGELNKAPGQTGFAASVAPVVYIPLYFIESTGLTSKGSRISYKYYFRFKNHPPSDRETEILEQQLARMGFDLDTVETQKRETGTLFEDLTRFLAIISFIALLLGCIGVAGAIHVYTREKYSMIAILRCLGASSGQAFFILLIQVVAIGLAGALSGAFLGSLIQFYLPVLLKDLLPMEIESGISLPAIIQGIATGLFITVLFTLLPLLNIRKISPLNTLRVSFEKIKTSTDPWRWLLMACILGFLLLFAYLLNGKFHESLLWVAGILTASGIFFLTSRLLTWGVRKYFPAGAPYVWRQGLSNLFRPDNQTILLVAAIGFGTCFIMLIFFLQTLLLERVKLTASENQPNMVVFDIRNEQRDSILTIAEKYQLPSKELVPIVNMRLEKLNSISYLKAQEDSTVHSWLFNREYRATYRDTLTPNESIAAGTYYGNVTDEGKIYISLDEGWAKRNSIKLGDTMIFNLQGVQVHTLVGSFRKVNWNAVSTNFLVVFPAGVLENAPQFHVFLTRTPDQQSTVAFQKELVAAFPNVSIIDIGLVLNILEELFDKIGFVISFIAAFSILTGLVVLLSSVLISKFQRIRESVLLRTLGASGKTIYQIAAMEYFLLGIMAAATGIIIALVSGWLLAEYSFKISFHPPLLPMLLLFLSIGFITTITGMLNIRQVIKVSPMEILRTETT